MRCSLVAIFCTVASRSTIRFCVLFPLLFDLEDGEIIFPQTCANYATSRECSGNQVLLTVSYPPYEVTFKPCEGFWTWHKYDKTGGRCFHFSVTSEIGPSENMKWEGSYTQPPLPDLFCGNYVSEKEWSCNMGSIYFVFDLMTKTEERMEIWTSTKQIYMCKYFNSYSIKKDALSTMHRPTVLGRKLFAENESWNVWIWIFSFHFHIDWSEVYVILVILFLSYSCFSIQPAESGIQMHKPTL
jgi:hypothetical protein